MIPKISASAPEPHLFEILVSRGFVVTELAAAFDPFRIANRLSGRTLFDLRVLAADGATRAVSLGGLDFAVATQADARRLPDLLVVTGGAGMAAALRQVLPRVQQVRHAGGVALVLSDAAQALLALGAAKTVVVHWEGRAVLAEAGIDETACTGLYARQGSLMTCAGMNATQDAVLALIAGFASPGLAREVGRVLLMERLRLGDTEQPKGPSDTPGLTSGPFRTALRIMEETLEFPVAIAQIARQVGLSSRQLERLFSRNLGVSPSAHYLRLRLQKARVLIEGTHLVLQEVALSCGFVSQSHFSRVFKQRYGLTPHNLRAQVATILQ